MNKQDGTREKIIAVSSKLFLTKGYEETRIADIIEGLDGLTKGAIYHHFESKEDIFNAVVDEIGKNNIYIFDEIKNNQHLNAAEKLSMIVKSSFDNENMATITNMAPNLTESPKLLSAFISEMKDITIPKYILPIINEGIKDGSINTLYPEEVAELLALLLNMWLNPLLFDNDESKISKKMRMTNDILEKFDISLFDEELINKFEK